MRALAFSDLHLDEVAADAVLREAPGADVVFGVGDFAQRRKGLAQFMERLAPMDDKAIYVPGNNETHDELVAVTKATVLHGEVIERDGLRIAGIGCAIPPLPPMPWGSFDLTEADAAAIVDDWRDVDVILSHSPPHGIADVHSEAGRIGSDAIRAVIERLQPKLVLCGHVHDSWGEEGMIGKSRIVNLGPKLNWFEL